MRSPYPQYFFPLIDRKFSRGESCFTRLPLRDHVQRWIAYLDKLTATSDVFWWIDWNQTLNNNDPSTLRLKMIAYLEPAYLVGDVFKATLGDDDETVGMCVGSPPGLRLFDTSV